MKITALILTVGKSHLFERCLATVHEQSVATGKIEIVRDVMPVSTALNEGLSRVKTELFVVVDDDMILDSDCFQILREKHLENPKLADVAFGLQDPITGPVLGIHMYKTELIRQFGFAPVEHSDELRWVTDQILKNGYEIHHELSRIVGVHHPEYLPTEAYWKFKVRAEKSRFYTSDGYRIFSKTLDSLCEQWVVSQNTVLIYAFAGLVDGVRSENVSSGFTYEGRDNAPGYQTLKASLGQLEGFTKATEQTVVLSEEEFERRIIQWTYKNIGEERLMDFVSIGQIVKYLIKRVLGFFKAEQVTV